LAMASLASMEPVTPFVSTKPIDSLMIVYLLGFSLVEGSK
jgi:hypothetical protein